MVKKAEIKVVSSPRSYRAAEPQLFPLICHQTFAYYECIWLPDETLACHRGGRFAGWGVLRNHSMRLQQAQQSCPRVGSCQLASCLPGQVCSQCTAPQQPPQTQLPWPSDALTKEGARWHELTAHSSVTKNPFPSSPTAELEKGGDWSSSEELMGSSHTHTRMKYTFQTFLLLLLVPWPVSSHGRHLVFRQWMDSEETLLLPQSQGLKADKLPSEQQLSRLSPVSSTPHSSLS